MIRQNDIGENTSNRFVDTCNICNLYCKGMGADYDGDTISDKLMFTNEANAELEKYVNSNAQFIALNGVSLRYPSMEAVQAIYNLTLTLDQNQLTDPKF